MELTEVTERDADQTPPDQQAHHHDVEVRRRREQAARLAHPAQVRHDDQPEQGERQRDLVPAQRRDRRRDRRDAGRDRHRHRQRVVDHQRRRRDERRSRPEVLAADDVRAAAARIRVQRLAVARGHDRQQRDHDQRDRHQVVERRHPRHRNQDDEDLLRRKRSRRDRIGPEDGQRDAFVQALLPQRLRCQRRPDQEPLQHRIHDKSLARGRNRSADHRPPAQRTRHDHRRTRKKRVTGMAGVIANVQARQEAPMRGSPNTQPASYRPMTEAVSTRLVEMFGPRVPGVQRCHRTAAQPQPAWPNDSRR